MNITPFEALKNIKETCDMAVSRGLILNMDEAHIMRESFILINNIVVNAVQQQQAQKPTIVSGDKQTMSND